MEPKWKGREQEYQKEYMREWRAKEKVLHDWQDQNEKRIEDRFVKLDTDDPAQMAMNQTTFAGLYLASKQMREIDELQEEERIYSELWKELEIEEAKHKEIG